MLPKDVTSEQARLMLRCLIRSRLENYGYDQKAWRRLQSQRVRARVHVRPYLGRDVSPAGLNWTKAPLAYRIDWANMSYTVGQSANEELTNLLRQLVNPDSKWVS